MFSRLKSMIGNHAFIWGLLFLHIYVLIIAPPSVVAMRTSAVPVRCPFRLAHQFLGKPTALMATALASSGVSKRSRRRDTHMLAARRFPQLQTLHATSLVHRASSTGSSPPFRYDHSLYAATATTATTVTSSSSFTSDSVAGAGDGDGHGGTILSGSGGDGGIELLHEPHHAVMVDQLVDELPIRVLPGGAKKKKSKSDAMLEVVVIGLSHHNTKVEVREKLAIPEERWNEASAQLCSYDSIVEAAVLSTCNRFEIYLAGEQQYEMIRDAMDFLSKRTHGNLDISTLHRNLFTLSGEDALWHLFRVSAGLDSLIVGEGQILAQVKKAYEHGVSSQGSAGKVVSRLLNIAVSAGKRVRSETGISKGAVSVSSAAAEFSAMHLEEDCRIMHGMREAKIAVIGAGKMARLLLTHLETHGVTNVTVVNRSAQRVQELQGECPGIQLDARPMDELWQVIAEADVVYPCTASTTTIIDPIPLTRALSQRTREGKVQLVDISVPRNVHPDCVHVSQVKCYNVDDLKAVVERNTALRRREMIEAEQILRDEMSKFQHWQHSLGAIPTITKLQEKAEAMRAQEMEKAARRLSMLSPKDLEVVDKMTKGIVAKLLHGPMSHLRQQAEGDATRAAILQVQQAFQL